MSDEIKKDVQQAEDAAAEKNAHLLGQVGPGC